MKLSIPSVDIHNFDARVGNELTTMATLDTAFEALRSTAPVAVNHMPSGSYLQIPDHWPWQPSQRLEDFFRSHYPPDQVEFVLLVIRIALEDRFKVPYLFG